MNGVKAVLLGLFIFSALTSAEASFYNSSKEGLKNAAQSDIKESETLRKRQELFRKTFLMSYEDWKELIKNPGSEGARQTRKKAAAICEFSEDSVLYTYLKEGLTGEEAKAHDAFWSHFSLDIARLKPEGKEAEEVFFNYVFPALIEMQVELDEVYGRFFSFEGLSAGEKFIIWQHFQHELKYLAEGNEMPVYLEMPGRKRQAGKKK